MESRPRVVVLSPAAGRVAGGVGTLTSALQHSMGFFAEPVVVAATSDTREGHRFLKARFFISALREARRPDVELVHAVTWRAAVPIAWLPRRLRPPLVVHCLGSEVLRVGALSKRLRNVVFRRAAATVAISSYTAGVVRGAVGVAPSVIHPSISLGVRARRGERDSSVIRVLSVARLVTRKGHQDLIAAVESARRTGASCTLTIAGEDGIARTALEEACVRHDWLAVEHSVSPARLNELYNASDVFALLTRDDQDEFEGFGVVFIEAASHGLPVIAGRSGGSTDAVADGLNGTVVGGVDEAAAALRQLCEDHALRRRMSDASLDFSSAFDAQCISWKLARLYRDVGACVSPRGKAPSSSAP